MDEQAVAREFARFDSVDALLQPGIFETASAVRTDPTKSDLLKRLRLDPDDAELWADIERPQSEDFGRESAAAARLMALLASVAQPIELKIVPYYGEAILEHSGWSQSEISSCLYGQRTRHFLAQLELLDGQAVAEMETWLAGGWFRPGESAHWMERLEDLKSTGHERVRDVASALVSKVGLDRSDVERIVESSLDGLRSLHLRAASNQDTFTWVIFD